MKNTFYVKGDIDLLKANTIICVGDINTIESADLVICINGNVNTAIANTSAVFNGECISTEKLEKLIQDKLDSSGCGVTQ